MDTDDSGDFPLPADIVVNPAGGLEAPPSGEGTYLIGPRFALLAPEFRDSSQRTWSGPLRNVLISIGARTRADIVTTLAEAVRRALPDVVLHVRDRPGDRDAASIRAVLERDARIEIHEGLVTRRALRLRCDAAVTAGGVTPLELAATATPTVAVSLAANQRETCGARD